MGSESPERFVRVKQTLYYNWLQLHHCQMLAVLSYRHIHYNYMCDRI